MNKYLFLRTDGPTSEYYIISSNDQVLAKNRVDSGRELASTVYDNICKILDKANMAVDDIDGIVVFSFSGSFTGLRIGTTVANMFGYSNDVKVVIAGGEDWMADGLAKLNQPKSRKFTPVIPKYDSDPFFRKII